MAGVAAGLARVTTQLKPITGLGPLMASIRVIQSEESQAVQWLEFPLNRP